MLSERMVTSLAVTIPRRHLMTLRTITSARTLFARLNRVASRTPRGWAGGRSAWLCTWLGGRSSWGAVGYPREANVAWALADPLPRSALHIRVNDQLYATVFELDSSLVGFDGRYGAVSEHWVGYQITDRIAGRLPGRTLFLWVRLLFGCGRSWFRVLWSRLRWGARHSARYHEPSLAQ
jgi:hypothetical protein